MLLVDFNAIVCVCVWGGGVVHANDLMTCTCAGSKTQVRK